MALYTRQVDVLDRHRIREQELRERLDQQRQEEEYQALLESFDAPPGSAFESHRDLDDPDWDDEDDDELHADDEFYGDADFYAGQAEREAASAPEREAAEATATPDNTAGTGDRVNGQGVNGERRDPDPGEP